MARVFFPEDIGHFIASLGEYQIDVFTDLRMVELAGPQRFEFCEFHGDDLWEYRRLIAPSRYAFLLFAYHKGSDSYIVLHSFRGGPEGPSRSDLREARRKRRAHQ